MAYVLAVIFGAIACGELMGSEDMWIVIPSTIAAVACAAYAGWSDADRSR